MENSQIVVRVIDTYYRYFRWLSLDVVLGGVILLRFLETHYQLHFGASIYVTLAAAIWLIYTTDHLIDSYKSAEQSIRRQFHLQHKRPLILAGGLVLMIALIHVFYLPIEIIKGGALLAAGCIGYLMVVYFIRHFWIKEFIIAWGYASGIFLAPMMLSIQIGLPDLMIYLQLVLVAFINLLMFSFFDYREDRANQFYSIPLLIGLKNSITLIHVCLVFSVLLIAISIYYTSPAYISMQIIFALMTGSLSIIFFFRNYFGYAERFRVVGDGIFYFPLFFIS